MTASLDSGQRAIPALRGSIKRLRAASAALCPRHEAMTNQAHEQAMRCIDVNENDDCAPGRRACCGPWIATWLLAPSVARAAADYAGKPFAARFDA